MIKISSIYEYPGFEIGLRIMVDKKWPENISKNSAENRSVDERISTEYRACKLVGAK